MVGQDGLQKGQRSNRQCRCHCDPSILHAQELPSVEHAFGTESLPSLGDVPAHILCPVPSLDVFLQDPSRNVSEKERELPSTRFQPNVSILRLQLCHQHHSLHSAE